MKVQVGAVAEEGNQARVFFLQLQPVDPMQLFLVEPVAEDAPAVIEDLGPLPLRLDLHGQLGQIERAVAGLLVGSEADDAELVLGLVKDLLAVGGQDARIDAADHQAVLLVLQLELADLLFLEVQDAAVDRAQGGVVVAFQGKSRDAAVAALDIDAHPDRRLLGGRVPLFRLGLAGLFSGTPLAGSMSFLSLNSGGVSRVRARA